MLWAPVEPAGIVVRRMTVRPVSGSLRKVRLEQLTPAGGGVEGEGGVVVDGGVGGEGGSVVGGGLGGEEGFVLEVGVVVVEVAFVLVFVVLGFEVPEGVGVPLTSPTSRADAIGGLVKIAKTTRTTQIRLRIYFCLLFCLALLDICYDHPPSP